LKTERIIKSLRPLFKIKKSLYLLSFTLSDKIFSERNDYTMSISTVKTRELKKLSLKIQALAALAAIAGAVALPQLLHVLGALSGAGTAFGEILLPMHLPVIFCGLIAGPAAGALAGFFSPIISFMLTGMPKAGMLPFMVIELLSYGLIAGLLRKNKINTLIKVLITQVGGRAVRAAAILFCTYIIGRSAVPVSIIWSSIITGGIGILMQWCLIPLTVFFTENYKKNENRYI
jgi:hypothetical protein